MTSTLDGVPVSVLVLTLNEERSIRACLESVRWADEVIVVDSFSTDRTVEIVHEYTDKVHQVPLTKMSDTGIKRNWAMENVPFTHEWVLSLDADNRVPEVLGDEISQALSTATVDGFLISQRYVFMGRPLTHCLGPMYQLKLFKHRLFRCDEAIHERPIFSGRVGYLKNYYIHDDKKSLYEYIERHNIYSTREAELYRQLRQQPLDFDVRRFLTIDSVARKQMLKRLWVRLPMRPFLLFLLFYVVRRGFLDGPEGLIFSILRGAGYEFLIGIKEWEMNRVSGRSRGQGE